MAIKINLLNNQTRSAKELPRYTAGTTRRNRGKEVTHGHVNNRRRIHVVEMENPTTPGHYYEPRNKDQSWTYITGSGRANMARRQQRWLREQEDLFGPNAQELMQRRRELQKQLTQVKAGWHHYSTHVNCTLPLNDGETCWKLLQMNYRERELILRGIHAGCDLTWPTSREELQQQVIELNVIVTIMTPFLEKMRQIKTDREKRRHEEQEQIRLEKIKRQQLEAIRERERRATWDPQITAFIAELWELIEQNTEIDPKSFADTFNEMDLHADDDLREQLYEARNILIKRWQKPLVTLERLNDNELHWGETRRHFKRLAAEASICNQSHVAKHTGPSYNRSYKRHIPRGHGRHGHRNGFDPDYRRTWRRNKRALERAIGIDRW